MTPSNIEAERALIGSILLNPSALHEVTKIVNGVDSFVDPAHKLIYGTILDLFELGDPVELLSIQSQLVSEGLLVYGLATPKHGQVHMSSLTSCIDGAFSATHFKYYADLVKTAEYQRNLINWADNMKAKALTMTPDNYGIVIDDMSEGFYNITDITIGEEKSNRSMLNLIVDSKDRAIEKANRYAETGSIVTGVTSGFNALDYLTCGWQGDDFAVIAARPGVGKTTLVMNMAEYAAAAGWVVQVYSMEMTAELLADKCMSSGANIDSMKLRRGTLTQEDFVRMDENVVRVQTSGAPIWIDDTTEMSIQKFRSSARRSQQEHGTNLILVDYLQLMHDDKYRGNRVLEIGSIAQGIKNLGTKLKIPVIATAQLNRAVEGRKDKRPQLSDLAESGKIEQAATICAFLYRDDYYEDSTPTVTGMTSLSTKPAEIIVEKNRNGMKGTVKVGYQGHHNKFVNYAKNLDAYAPPENNDDEAYIPENF